MTGFKFSLGMNASSAGAKPSGGVSAETQNQIYVLRDEIERLLIINEALWSFIRDQHGLSDEDLIKKIAEIDLKDGKLDGRVAPEAKDLDKCPQCGRPVGKKRQTCLYCGAALVRDPFAR
jgi:hypothetical protein